MFTSEKTSLRAQNLFDLTTMGFTLSYTGRQKPILTSLKGSLRNPWTDGSATDILNLSVIFTFKVLLEFFPNPNIQISSLFFPHIWKKLTEGKKKNNVGRGRMWHRKILPLDDKSWSFHAPSALRRFILTLFLWQENQNSEVYTK